MDDRAIVARQLGRPPRAFGRVVVRCPYGSPAVTEQMPYDVHGEPFPTTYYLTCPHLVAAIARLEAAGGVERWSLAVGDDEALADSLMRATEEQRRLRHELADDGRGTDNGASLELGIGGSRTPSRLKCLHAHVAYALARPGYTLGDRILREVAEPWPVDGLLLRATPGRSLISPLVSADLESAKLEWEHAHRDLVEVGRDPTNDERVRGQLDVLAAELRRRVGGTFTLRELADEYAVADGWARDVLAEHAAPGWLRTLALVEGAAFHLYARGAVDYQP